MKRTIFLALATILVLAIGYSYAVEVTLLGPKQYCRTDGNPNLFTDTFPGRSGSGRIVVQNGGVEGIDLVSGAIVKINGIEVFGNNDFNQKALRLESPISLNESNTIFIELRSKPNTNIVVLITQDLDAQAAGVVGPAGGEIQISNPESKYFETSLRIPEGALNEEIVISIHEPCVFPPVPSRYIPGDVPVELMPEGLVFNAEASLVIPAKGQVNKQFYFYNLQRARWTMLESYLDEDTSCYVIALNHFSLVNSLCRESALTVSCRTFDIGDSVKYLVNATIQNSLEQDPQGVYDAVWGGIYPWNDSLEWRLPVTAWTSEDNEGPTLTFSWNALDDYENLPFGALAVTDLDESGKIYIMFNDTGRYRWTVNNTLHNFNLGIISIQAVVLHEMGHALGLSHQCSNREPNCYSCRNYTGIMGRRIQEFSADLCLDLLSIDEQRIRDLYQMAPSYSLMGDQLGGLLATDNGSSNDYRANFFNWDIGDIHYPIPRIETVGSEVEFCDCRFTWAFVFSADFDADRVTITWENTYPQDQAVTALRLKFTDIDFGYGIKSVERVLDTFPLPGIYPAPLYSPRISWGDDWLEVWVPSIGHIPVDSKYTLVLKFISK